MPAGALIGGLVSGVVGAGASIYGSTKAADAQKYAADQGNQLLRDQYGQNQQNLAPWMTGGKNAFDLTQYLMGVTGSAPAGYGGGMGGSGSLTARFAPTMDQLAKTPGYQWTLDQGLKSTQNSYASKGLASSGAAMKGAADYASGLASNTYQQQFQNYWGENQNIYNMLTGQSNSGLQAAGTLAGTGTQLAGMQNQNTIGAGNAQAAMWNSFGPGLSGIGNSMLQYGLLSKYLGSNGTSPPPAPRWDKDTSI